MAHPAPEPGGDRAAADGRTSTDASLPNWFITGGERRNAATDIRPWTTGNQVLPLVDGAVYFEHLYRSLTATGPGDVVYLVDFRGDTRENLSGPGTGVGAVLSDLSRRSAVRADLAVPTGLARPERGCQCRTRPDRGRGGW